VTQWLLRVGIAATLVANAAHAQIGRTPVLPNVACSLLNVRLAAASLRTCLRRGISTDIEDLDALARDWLTYWLLDIGTIGPRNFDEWVAGWNRPEFLRMPELALLPQFTGRGERVRTLSIVGRRLPLRQRDIR
jgi:hypothetical protein